MLGGKLFKKQETADTVFAGRLALVLGFKPGKIEVYRMAFRHRSAAVTLSNGFKASNERLEFLGDAILGAVIADVIFKRFPYRNEGFMTEMRSKIVSRNNLNTLAAKLGFDELVETATPAQANTSNSMLGDAFEALIGAIYIDRGFNYTARYIKRRIIAEHLDLEALEREDLNHKSKILEWCQQDGKKLRYECQVVDTRDEGKLFNCALYIDDKHICAAKDFSKKNAEKLAAGYACKLLNI